jgi:hypothetical protein
MKDRNFIENYTDNFLEDWTAVTTTKKPIIAAVNGMPLRHTARQWPTHHSLEYPQHTFPALCRWCVLDDGAVLFRSVPCSTTLHCPGWCRLCAWWWMRTCDDVRHHCRGQHSKVRPARNQARHNPGWWRNPAPHCASTRYLRTPPCFPLPLFLTLVFSLPLFGPYPQRYASSCFPPTAHTPRDTRRLPWARARRWS